MEPLVEPGQTFVEWEVVRLLGRGGMVEPDLGAPGESAEMLELPGA